MGSASFKASRTPPPDQQKEDNKNITIGVFGLDDAGKTSIVKALEGVPSDHVPSTIGSSSTMITHTMNEKGDRNSKNKGQQRIKIVDVSGARKFRQQSWSQFYDQIHGLIFVIDASEKNRWRENQETLEDLLEHDELKNKPILILANKQDQKGALNNENELKRKLDIARLKGKYQIELCTALPQNQKNKVDESIRKGFSWLIRTIDENYIEINSRLAKTKSSRINIKSNRIESDDNENDNQYSKGKSIDYRSKITSQKLPSINTNRNKVKISSDDDDDDVQKDRNHAFPTNSLDKKKKPLGVTGNNHIPIKKFNDNEPKAFRATYETFPEETPWTTPTSTLKQTKSDDMLSRLLTKPPLPGDTRKRTVSPLIRDAKPYTNGSLSKRDKDSDDEETYKRQQTSKTTSRFDSSSLPANRFSSTIKKPISTIYDDDEDDHNNNRRTTTTVKKSYDHDDDDEFETNYLKKSASMKSNQNYNYNDNKTHPRSSDRLNLNSEYRGTSTKPASRSTYDYDTNNRSPYSRKETSSKFKHEDEDDDYSSSKPVTRSTYNSKPTDYSKYDDDHHQRWPSSKPISRTKFNKNDDDDDDDDYPSSSSKPATHSRFEDDDYPSSSSKAVTQSKYDDDDDDEYGNDYSHSSKKNNYPSSSYNNSSRPRYETNDYFTSKQDSSTTRRYPNNTGYDS